MPIVNAMNYDFNEVARMLPDGGKFKVERIYFFEEVDSTNAWIFRQKNIDGLCCITDHQSSGKGRQGRTWVDRKGGSILISMGWEVEAGHCSVVSLVAGLAVVESLKEQGIGDVQLKWPNDILFNSRKLGGILVEKSSSRMVVGLGLNVQLKTPLMLEIEQPWTDIVSTGFNCNINQLLSAILRNMGEMVTACMSQGFSRYAEYWNSLDAFKGRTIKACIGQDVLLGIERGVDESGALLIETGHGLQSVHSGDVSLHIEDRQAQT